MNANTKTQGYIVRANRGRARIWIQGTRLTEAGFTPGRHYRVERDADLALHLISAEADRGEEVRKVSGKGDLAIIDISGKGAAPFNTGDLVTITYRPGLITIRPEGK